MIILALINTINIIATQPVLCLLRQFNDTPRQARVSYNIFYT